VGIGSQREGGVLVGSGGGWSEVVVVSGVMNDGGEWK
jgi:hypothetical protein